MASSIANQFTGLPIENLIAAPLLAAAEGLVRLNNNLIKQIP